MPRGSEALTNARRDEIITACAMLYETMNYDEITLTEIAEYTSFTRPSIYNYFHTREEIFLALLRREYEQWTASLDSLAPTGRAGAKEEFAAEVACALEMRVQLLHLLAASLYDMEQNSRIERLVELKTAFGASLTALDNCLGRFFPAMSAQERSGFVGSFLPLMNGIYPYSYSTDKQREAIKLAGLDFKCRNIYEIAYPIIIKLLGEY